MTKEELETYDITVVPLQVIFGTETYREGFDLNEAEFYQRIENSSTLPTTSQPPIGEFVEAYENLSKEYNRAISIHLSSGISGTCQGARTASSMLEDFPVDVVDSEIATYAFGFMVIEAL